MGLGDHEHWGRTATLLSVGILLSIGTTATPIPAQERGRKVVTEVSSVVKRAPIAWQGEMVISGDSANCRSLSYTVNVKHVVTAGETRKQPSYMASLQVPGIVHKYIGTVCFPLQHDSLTLEVKGLNVQAHQEMDKNGDWYLPKGSVVTVTGTVHMTLPTGLSALRIRASAPDTLVFLLTDGGYRYIRGTGSVETPAGRTYQFP